jgi:VIT1/CCC1 family predicted Fe2+/Mn2+ transporter
MAPRVRTGQAGPVPTPHHHRRHGEYHRSGRSGWLRAAVLGADDGILSTAALIVGVAGSGAAVATVRTAGIAAIVAGALSMAKGEYVSVAAQRDAEQADLLVERQELEEDPQAELAELTEIWRGRGLDPAVAEVVARQLTDKDALAAHARDELGLTDLFTARPLQASLASALSFATAALVPLLGYLAWAASGRTAFVVVLTVLALAVLGAVGARLGGAPWRPAAVRVAAAGLVIMLVTMGVGHLVGHTAGSL